MAITIPARSESERIISCLNAAAASLRGRGGIVVTVNGSTDDTFKTAENWFSGTGCPGVLLDDLTPPPGTGVGRARRIAVSACRDKLCKNAVLMTTDADSQVACDWVDENLSELSVADLICGSVLPDPDDLIRLPETFAQRGAIEGNYNSLTLAVRRTLDPVPWDAEPTHQNAAGASLAFRPELYDDISGFPDTLSGEDRAFAARAEARGWRVRHSARAKVVTSCRLDGRAPGGMAAALVARISETDPMVDECLEPAETTVLRARLRGDLRRRIKGVDFERAWAQLEKSRPELRRHRLRLSDLARELPLLSAAVAGLGTEVGGGNK